MGCPATSLRLQGEERGRILKGIRHNRRKVKGQSKISREPLIKYPFNLCTFQIEKGRVDSQQEGSGDGLEVRVNKGDICGKV